MFKLLHRKSSAISLTRSGVQDDGTQMPIPKTMLELK